MGNPVIQTLMLFVGAYTVLTVLGKMGPFDKIVTIMAGMFASIIWMAHYNRALLYSLSLKPVLGPVIHHACKIAHEQPPVDMSYGTDETITTQQPETPKLQLHSDGDFAMAARQVKQVIFGHDDSVNALIGQIRRNVQLRENSSAQAVLPPIGVFVLAGKPGLGKKSLAVEIGYLLYSGSSVSILDVSDPSARGSLLISEARTNPYTAFVLENFQSAPAAMQEDLLSIFAGAPQVEAKTGAKVSFRHCFFFLLVHRDAAGMEQPANKGGGGTGQTMVVDSLSQSMALDKRLAWSLHGIYPFVLPEPLQQAEVVAKIIAQECKAYNLTLGRVAASILAREVQESSSRGGFEITPARISKIMHNRLADAVAAKQQLVDFDDDRRVPAQKYQARPY